MVYKYREMKCPWCDHVFIWNENGKEGVFFHIYKLKETGESVETTKCPKCEMEIAVLEHVFEGIDVNDDRIELIVPNKKKT